MSANYRKNHDGWNVYKKALDRRSISKDIYFYEREVWFCAIGHNIGFEEDGKGSQYSRPVVILRKLGRNLFIGIPLTSHGKQTTYTFGVGEVQKRNALALISQIRLFSSKRLLRKIDTLPIPVFEEMKKAAKKLIF